MICNNCGSFQNNKSVFCTNCGEKLISEYSHSLARKKKIIALIIFLMIGAIVLLSIMEEENKQSIDPLETNEIQRTLNNYNQNEITASVVNILCPSTSSNEEMSGGSGTIISEEGLVLTNSHVIPQDDESLLTDEDGCLVVLPNQISGKPEEIYWAEPIVLNEVSDTYDLAFLSINEAYYDEQEEEYMGTYPKIFPAFNDENRCENEKILLGESVRIFGYPQISGGYSLTITDGIVSSFPGDGLIITSAKISNGNSGGLAVDKNGCMIGVPSMVSTDENESLGVIISTDLIIDFIKEVETLLDD